MTNRALQRKIHVACRELGIESDVRHDIQMSATGKASMRDMTERDLKAVLKLLETKGWKPSQGGKPKHKAADRRDVRFIHVMWRLLGEAGALKQPSRAGLNAFIRKRFEAKWGAVPLDVDALTDWKQIKDVVQALRDWCVRAGVVLDR